MLHDKMGNMELKINVLETKVIVLTEEMEQTTASYA